MVEITNSALAFDKGYVLTLSQTLPSGQSINIMKIDVNGNTSVDTHIMPSTTNVIIKSWGVSVPPNGNVCFTVDTGCITLTLSMSIGA